MVARVCSTWLWAQDGCVSCFRFGGPGGFETWMSDGMVREADSQAGTLWPTWNHPLISFAINVGNVCGDDVWIMTARSTRHCQTPFGSFGTWPGFKRLSPPFEQRKSKALQVCKHRGHFKPCKPKAWKILKIVSRWAEVSQTSPNTRSWSSLITITTCYSLPQICPIRIRKAEWCTTCGPLPGTSRGIATCYRRVARL